MGCRSLVLENNLTCSCCFFLHDADTPTPPPSHSWMNTNHLLQEIQWPDIMYSMTLDDDVRPRWADSSRLWYRGFISQLFSSLVFCELNASQNRTSSNGLIARFHLLFWWNGGRALYSSPVPSSESHSGDKNDGWTKSWRLLQISILYVLDCKFWVYYKFPYTPILVQ